MFILGLSGGIASGKSTLSHHLKTQGYAVIDADIIARQVVARGTLGYSRIIKAFHDPSSNQNILLGDGELDRKALGKIIFDDINKRKVLNGITHPLVRFHMLKEMMYYYLSGHAIVILDVPLLFESGIYKYCHANLLVNCPYEIQLQRIIKRDNLTKEEAKQRIDAQMKLEDKIPLTQFVIDNSGEIENAKRELDQVIKKITPSRIRTLFWQFIPFVAISGIAFWIKRLI